MSPRTAGQPPLSSTIEHLEGRVAPAVVSIINAGLLSISSDGASDTVAIRNASGDATMLVVDVGNDGTTDFSAPKASFNSVFFTGLAGSDHLIISYVNGDPLGAKPLTTDLGGDTGDSLAIAGSGIQVVSATPSGTAAHAGSMTIGSATITYSRANGGVALGSLASAAISTPSGADTYTIGSASAGVGLISGTSGTQVHTFTYTSVTGLTLDLGVNDGAATTADQLTIDAFAGTGLRDFTVGTGGGSDLLTLSIPSLELPAPGGAFSYNAGAGSDTIVVAADASMTLSNIVLEFTGAGSVALGGVEVANLTGGTGANTFNVGGWSGTGTLDGAGGSDTVDATNDVADFALSDTGLARANLGTLSLSSIEVANLTGGAGTNAFNVSSWSGTGTLDGGAGTSDTIVAFNDVSDFFLSNLSLARTGLGTLSLAGMEAASLTGGDGPNTFAANDWPGSVDIDGLSGNDTIVVTSDVANFTLSNSSLTRTGLGTLTLTSIETANLAGGTGANTLDLAGWSGTGSFDGAGGSDSVLLGISSDTATVTGNNSASITGFSFADIDSLDGAGGTNSLVNTSGSAFSAATLSVAGITVANFGAVNTPALSLTTGADSFPVTDVGAGTFDGVSFTGLTTVDSLDGLDSITLTAANDSITVTATGAATTSGIAFSNIENLDGAGGINSVTLTADADAFTISGTRAGSGLGIAFANLDSIDGAGGTDTLTLSRDSDITLANTVLLTADGLNFVLANFEVANLTGGAGANIFSVSGWTGNGTLTGDGSADTVVAIKSQTADASTHGFTFTLTDSALSTSDGMSFTLAAIANADLSAPQNLPGNYRFDVAGWSHDGIFSAANGTNLFVAGTGKQSFNGGSGKDTYFLRTGADVDYTLTDRSSMNQDEKGDRISFELASTGVTFDLFALKGKSVTETVIQQLNKAGTAGKVTIKYLDANTNPDKPGKFLSPFQNIEGSKFADKLRGAGDGSTEDIYGGASDRGVKVTDRLTGGKGVNFLLGGDGNKQKTIFAKGGPGIKYAFKKVDPADAFTAPSRYADLITNFSSWA